MTEALPREQMCPVCANRRRECFRAQILRKYEVGYLLCDCCGLLQTEKPYWMGEAYSSAISLSDTGLVARNLRLSKVVAGLLYFMVDKDARYLDVAGGYGLLTRLMRDFGFDFYWADPYCENIHARGFEAAEIPPPFAAVTAFEVLEHLEDPLEYLRRTLNESGAEVIIASTLTFEGAPPAADWWYYGREHGQHVTFFQPGTLHALASALGMQVLSSGMVHMFTRRPKSKTLFRVLASRLSLILEYYIRLRMKSRMVEDSRIMLSRTRG